MLDVQPEVVGDEPGTYEELRKTAEAFEHPGDYVALRLSCDGLEIKISLEIDSGTARGVEYFAATSGLPIARFRRENSDDVSAKERAIVRELQTGDETFDQAVYIESDADDADLRVLLAAPAVRRAITAALVRCDEIIVSEGGVSAKDRERPKCYSPSAVRDILTPIRVIAGAPRSARPTPEAPRTLGRSVVSSVYVFAPIGVFMIWLGYQTYEPISSPELIIKGGFVGILFAALLQPLLTRLVRGRSTSHRELVPIRAISFIGLTVFGAGLAICLNGALDKSAERVETTPVTSISYDEEHPKRSTLHLRSPSGVLEITVDDPGRAIPVGAPVELFLRNGAFGMPWKSRPSVVTFKSPPKK